MNVGGFSVLSLSLILINITENLFKSPHSFIASTLRVVKVKKVTFFNHQPWMLHIFFVVFLKGSKYLLFPSLCSGL